VKKLCLTFFLVFSICLTGDAKKPAPGNILRETGDAFAQIAEAALPAVVFIDVEATIEIPRYGYRVQPYRDAWGRYGQMAVPQELEPERYSQEGQGSGFIISKDGYILTNNHVVNNADRITVILSDGRKFSASVVGSDPKTEVALIKINNPEDLPYLKTGDSDALRVGEWVLAAGNPFGLSQTITAGIVSAKGRSGVGIAEYGDFIQTDAAINPGNSGGPLLDINGDVVGINTAIFSKTGGYMGIGFAIPINQAMQIKEQLIDHGKICRSVIGVYIQDLDDDLAESFGVKQKDGVLISQVMKGSSAEEAGLLAGDVVIEMDGKAVQKASTFRNRVASTLPGTEILFKICRNGAMQEVRVVTKEMKDGRAAAADPEILERIGMTVDDADRAPGPQSGGDGSGGVVITDVKPNSPAWRAGLQPGNLILSVNRQPVEKVSEVMAKLSETEGRRILLLVSDGSGSRYTVVQKD
jgi:serine protease Do